MPLSKSFTFLFPSFLTLQKWFFRHDLINIIKPLRTQRWRTLISAKDSRAFNPSWSPRFSQLFNLRKINSISYPFCHFRIKSFNVTKFALFVYKFYSFQLNCTFLSCLPVPFQLNIEVEYQLHFLLYKIFFDQFTERTIFTDTPLAKWVTNLRHRRANIFRWFYICTLWKFGTLNL